MMILNDAFFILQWIIIFGVTESLGGYGFREVMLLWAISAMGYGIAHAFFSGAFNIANLIYEGRLDVFLTQPKNVLINLICSETSVSALGDIAYSFIALVIAGATWWWYLAIIPVGIVGALIYVGITICFQTLSFYVKRGSAIADTVGNAMIMFSNYPPIIFNAIAKVLLYTIIPCGFMIFVPFEYLFLNFNIIGVLIMIGVALFVTILAFMLFKKGLKKYNSGSLMGGRL
jgi:ABC-2 type transport system permease protein